jgi:hypothetical protein
LTDAIVIAVDGLVHHDKLFAATKRYASPNIWARTKARSLEERIMTSSLCLSMIFGQTLGVCPEVDHARWAGRRSDKSKLRPFTLGKRRDGLAEDIFLEMLGLLVGSERGFRRKYFVEEELLRFGYALMDLEFLHARFPPRLGKKFPQQACDGILLARLGFPKCGNDETLVGAIRIHGLSPSMLTRHSPQGAIGRRLARPLVRILRCAPNQRRPRQTGRKLQKAVSLTMDDGSRVDRCIRPRRPGRVCALAPRRQAA